MAGWILTLVLLSPLAGVLLLMFGGDEDRSRLRMTALLSSVVTFVLAIVAFSMFGQAAESSGQAGGYHLEQSVAWIGGGEADSDIDIRYHVGVDGVSIWLLMLTAFLTPLAIWGSFSAITKRVRAYYALLLLLEVGMIGVFFAMDLLLFYVCFEFTLIPCSS